MKNTKKLLTLLLGHVLCTGFLIGQTSTMDLYLQPDLQSEKLQTIEEGDPRLGPESPVLDEISAAVGWHFAEFNGTINGFVPDSKIGKDLFPVDNAIIYSRASSDSPVITSYTTGDELEIIDTGAWWEVRLTTAFPVYFLVDTLDLLPPPLVTDTTTEDMVFVEGSGPSTSGITLAPPAPPKIPANITGQSYQGIFKKSKKGLGLFAPKAPFNLQDTNGNRIAWIETSGLIGPGNLDKYLNKTVLIHGEREFDVSKKEWIIHARNMRLK